ncbi:1,4-dihydroxy-2-naphthoate polyprenyltransferase [Actinobacteria bacterium YIM 96077]|uniref:1,4-dihydroxy-2-naphthoate octaprenyltransferase n=1 Tax=Phytoactinopolyspora halophila TaxID=1981511 RepID=A0A329QNY4_9ACTN|nr:1,4-dihydroxy-2-naphthoate polyprenyltransferase [Phytoactinopolyspora halophila]AYY14798.1 1,4-dihydroxy-2-naphthoate polyprenyltransferase [Actinobacteria bacterium YIM 96077]RAW13072.1 1,4-dihydroxy-2-naphthoate polyprenyltransferase [Phytoactinopolyspora halophila]
MTTLGQWSQGARLRTLPAAISPVLVGTGAAAATDSAHPGRALLALLVAIALQVGVNYANDYSDGVRGTDDDRVGPFRLVGSGAATAPAVRLAAWASFATGAIAGLILVALTGDWWLLAVGAAAIVAAWYYTGGSRPYGYRALGEASVFVFFGLVAVLGTMYVQAGRITVTAALAAVGVGSLACALLLVNNVRDAPKDAAAGKRTLAVAVGESHARLFYAGTMTLPFVLVLFLIGLDGPWTALALLAVPAAAASTLPVVRGASGVGLIPALRATSMTGLLFAALLALGFALS